VSVLAHQRAHLFYGPEYKRIAEVNKESLTYNETARQESQVRMLYYDRIDVIVLAHEIFMYFKSNGKYVERDKKIVVSKIFGDKFGFYNAFWNKKVRDDFNSGLYKIKENGTYHQILNKCLQVYDNPL
jgi:ABC-type amino acid transport substrate-binding protein